MPKKKTVKKTTKKPAKKLATPPSTPEKSGDKILQPVKVAGAASVRSVDDLGEITKGEAVKVKPYLDENGVLIMVPQTD